MGELSGFIWCAMAGLFRSRAALQVEILVFVISSIFCTVDRRSGCPLAGSIAWYFAGSSLVSHGAACTKDPSARDRYPLASRWFPSILALEITTAQRPAKDLRGHSPPHSRDERCQPLVGSATDSRRTAQARDRRRPDHGCKIHGQEKTATVARLEDLPSQSCRRHHVDRPVCRPDDFVSAVVYASGPFWSCGIRGGSFCGWGWRHIQVQNGLPVN
jgi:hypothetical protein